MDILLPKRLIEDQKNNIDLYNAKKKCIQELPKTIYNSGYNSNIFLIIILLLILAAYTKNMYIFGLFWLSIPAVRFYEYIYFPYQINKKKIK